MNSVLYVPSSVVVATWLAFQEGAQARVESTLRWAGPASLRASLDKVVTTVINPYQRVSSGFFEVPHEGTRAMGIALGSNGLMNFAQIHTHPTSWIDHSKWDDERAYSRANGALSIVWPDYGAPLPAFAVWGIHERIDGEWRRLDELAAAERIKVIPETITLRGALEVVLPDEMAHIEDSRDGC
jgi:hypothetical protein